MAKSRKVPKFKEPASGEWIQPVESPRAYLLQCCDCGLVHSVHFRVGQDRKGKQRAHFKVYRNERVTRAVRRKRNINIVRSAAPVAADKDQHARWLGILPALRRKEAQITTHVVLQT